MTDTHFSQRDLARRLGLSPRTLEGWRWRGAGPRFVKARRPGALSARGRRGIRSGAAEATHSPSSQIQDECHRRKGWPRWVAFRWSTFQFALLHQNTRWFFCFRCLSLRRILVFQSF
jgi:hypothetical protein